MFELVQRVQCLARVGRPERERSLVLLAGCTPIHHMASAYLLLSKCAHCSLGYKLAKVSPLLNHVLSAL